MQRRCAQVLATYVLPKTSQEASRANGNGNGSVVLRPGAIPNRPILEVRLRRHVQCCVTSTLRLLCFCTHQCLQGTRSAQATSAGSGDSIRPDMQRTVQLQGAHYKRGCTCQACTLPGKQEQNLADAGAASAVMSGPSRCRFSAPCLYSLSLLHDCRRCQTGSSSTSGTPGRRAHAVGPRQACASSQELPTRCACCVVWGGTGQCQA